MFYNFWRLCVIYLIILEGNLKGFLKILNVCIILDSAFPPEKISGSCLTRTPCQIGMFTRVYARDYCRMKREKNFSVNELGTSLINHDKSMQYFIRLPTERTK